MRTFFEIAYTGLVSVVLHPLRSAVTIACLVAVLLPYLAGLGLSKGVQQQAEDSIRFGADLYVTGRQFGRTVPVPLDAVDKVRLIDGVTEVIPRIVGSITLGKDRVQTVVVGMPADRLPRQADCVQGRLYADGQMNELVVGTALAHRLKLEVGSLIPPFYRNVRGERVSQVVGIFRSDVSIWESNLVFTSFETAATIFDQQGLATGLLVNCRPGYQPLVARSIVRLPAFSAGRAGATVRAQVTSREDLKALIPQGMLHREGIFNLHFLLAFAVGIAVVLVASGFGSAERRREIGILKATGWQTDEVLLRGLAESVVLGLLAASISIVAAYIWLQGFNGYWIASIFLAGVDKSPAFHVPFYLTPVPVLLAFLIALIVVMTGTLYSSWRAATAAPVEAMR